jgi:hypothetical protein
LRFFKSRLLRLVPLLSSLEEVDRSSVPRHHEGHLLRKARQSRQFVGLEVVLLQDPTQRVGQEREPGDLIVCPRKLNGGKILLDRLEGLEVGSVGVLLVSLCLPRHVLRQRSQVDPGQWRSIRGSAEHRLVLLEGGV